ncbi:MAG TPA: hypothetical protein VGH90_11190 [Chthoniobacteraceae bacterium]|jgi:hypothetical protein
MREILAAIFLIVAVSVFSYQSSPNLRETFRGWRAGTDETERMDAYKQGKALFLAASTSDPAPRCEAWGDDPDEDAKPVLGEIWLAHGHFTSGGGVTSSPWCVLFQVNQGSPLICVSGQDASKVIYLIGANQYQTAINQFAPSDSRLREKKPVRGDWMWQKGSSLDQPARRDGS